MPAYYLDTIIGVGTYLNPFRARGGEGMIDLRPDPTVQTGFCLTSLPDQSDGPGRTFLGLDTDLDSVSLSAQRVLERILNRTLSATTLRQLIGEVLMDGKGVWKPLEPTVNGMYEAHLGGQRIYQQPSISGGATFTENWNCANSTSSLSCNNTWTQYTGAQWTLNSNAANLLADGTAEGQVRIEQDTNTANQIVQMDITSVTLGVTGFSGLVMSRKDSSTTQTFYLGDLVITNLLSTTSAYQAAIYKNIAGTYTLLSSANIWNNTSTTPTLDTMRFTANGTSLTYEDVTQGQTFTLTDSSIDGTTVGGKRGGIRGGGGGAAQAENMKLDNFILKDILTVTPTLLLTGVGV